MKHRSKASIIAKILQVASSGGATRSQIMYRAFLSYVQLKEYLVLLQNNGLLQYDAETKTFKSTDKGAKFQSLFRQLGELVSEESLKPDIEPYDLASEEPRQIQVE